MHCGFFFQLEKMEEIPQKKISNWKKMEEIPMNKKKEVDDLLKNYFNLSMLRLRAQIYSEQGEKGSRRFVKKIL